MALEEGAVSLNDTFYCGGNVSVIGRTGPIRCWKTTGHGSQTLTQAAQHSCNAAFVNIGLRVGAERFYDYCEAFGFLRLSDDPDASLTAKTGIDLSGEAGASGGARIHSARRKNLSQLAAASFGQTLQLPASARVRRERVCERRVPDGALRCAADAEPRRERCIRARAAQSAAGHKRGTSEKVRTILEQVVGDSKEGTGRNAAVKGYRIGGKTGTSEKVSLEAQTGQKEYIVSFIGFAPADKPRIALLVFLDTPSNRSGIYISGGQMAAPVVGSMMADILPYMGVEAETDAERGEAVMPMAVGQSLHGAAELIKDAGLRYRTIGYGDTVTRQLPAAGSAIAEGAR